jgi:hypothetical protein
VINESIFEFSPRICLYKSFGCEPATCMCAAWHPYYLPHKRPSPGASSISGGKNRAQYVALFDCNDAPYMSDELIMLPATSKAESPCACRMHWQAQSRRVCGPSRV